MEGNELRRGAVFVVILGVVIAGAVGLAALYDYRARRIGARIGVATDGAPDSCLRGLKLTHRPHSQDGQGNWTHRHLDQAP